MTKRWQRSWGQWFWSSRSTSRWAFVIKPWAVVLRLGRFGLIVHRRTTA